MVHVKTLFESLFDALNISVALPTGLGIAIVRLNESLILKNVLYI